MIFYRKIFDMHCFTHKDANNRLGLADAGQTHMFFMLSCFSGQIRERESSTFGSSDNKNVLNKRK